VGLFVFILKNEKIFIYLFFDISPITYFLRAIDRSVSFTKYFFGLNDNAKFNLEGLPASSFSTEFEYQNR